MNRRGFLGGLLGLVASAALLPLSKPRIEEVQPQVPLYCVGSILYCQRTGELMQVVSISDGEAQFVRGYAGSKQSPIQGEVREIFRPSHG